MRLDSDRVVEQQKKRLEPGKIARTLTVAMAVLFFLALAVQILRGKLWIVGTAGVWLLLVATLLAAGATWAISNPAKVKEATQATRQRLTFYGLALSVLTLFGLWLRVWGQKIGLPYIIPADESLIVDATTRILQTGNFDPGMYFYPGLFIYLETGVAGLNFVWGSLNGLYHNLAQLPPKTFAITTAPQMYLWQRTFAALFGAAAIPLAYGVVKTIWNDRRAALLAAGLVAFSSLATEHSHYIAVDMPMATLALATLWPAANILKRGYTRDYVLTGVLAGLATGTKWNGMTLLVLPILAHLFRLIRTVPPGENRFSWVVRRILSRELWWALFAAAGAFLLSTPYIFARIQGYTDAFQGIITKYRLSNAENATDYPFIGNMAAIWEDSLPLFVLGVGGLLLAAFRRKFEGWLVLAFPLAYTVSINGYRLIYKRNVLPLTLYFALLAAVFTVWLLDKVVERVKALRENRYRQQGYAAALLVILLAGMWAPLDSIFYGNKFNDQPFSYSRVEDWLKANAGPGALKMVEMRPQQWGDYPNTLALFDDKKLGDYTLDYLRERGIQYAAINREIANGTGNKGIYADLFKPERLALQVETKAIEMPGPAYTIARTGVTPETLKLQHPLNADFSGKLRLLGVNSGKIEALNQIYLPPANEAGSKASWPTYKPGDIVGLAVYWQVLAPVGQDYTVFIQLRPVDKPDVNAASRDTPPLQGAYPTSQWKAGEIITDSPNLALPADIAPGDYSLLTGLYLNDGKFTPLSLADGKTVLALGTITIRK